MRTESNTEAVENTEGTRKAYSARTAGNLKTNVLSGTENRYVTDASSWVPKTSRMAAQISPSVAYAFTAA